MVKIAIMYTSFKRDQLSDRSADSQLRQPGFDSSLLPFVTGRVPIERKIISGVMCLNIG